MSSKIDENRCLVRSGAGSQLPTAIYTLRAKVRNGCKRKGCVASEVQAAMCRWFANSGAQKRDFGAKFAPKGSILEPKWHPKRPKWRPKMPKGAKNEPKGCQKRAFGAKRVPKGSQRATKMHPKIDVRKRSPKRDGPPPCFWETFWTKSIKNAIKNRCQNSMPKK